MKQFRLVVVDGDYLTGEDDNIVNGFLEAEKRANELLDEYVENNPDVCVELRDELWSVTPSRYIFQQDTYGDRYWMKMRFGSYGTPISARLLTEDEEFELDELREEKETHMWDLTKEELEQLRKEVCVGSCFISDYENSFNINPDEVCDYCDGYWEFLWSEYKEEAENIDSPEEFAIYCMHV